MNDYPDTTPEAQDSDDRLWGCIAHLSTLLPIPLFNLLGPIIVMMAKGSDSYFAKRQAIAALNFQLTVIIAYVICIPLVFVIIGIPMLWVVGIGSMVLTFIAGIKAFDGETYPYPFSFHFIS
ncbi:MAG: DUF4870 domain-containing protein [Planctomycetota bacterium]|nr:DUF4870 domain-containing protein [Planctomycetota bacterium]